jgi:hypothetical protein
VEVSEFGATFIKQLPLELQDIDDLTEDEKENVSVMNQLVKKRGSGINFQEFASQTQTLIHKELNGMFRVKSQNVDNNESRRKQLLHHNNWMNEQKLIKHKLSDTHSRLEQIKFSEYDWKRESECLKQQKCEILNHWEATFFSREKRMKSKLKKMMERKYPGRAESCQRSLLLKKAGK